jgi:hypothetical protein
MTAAGASPAAVATDAPAPSWRLATMPELAGPTSVLWDVVSVDATHAWAVGSEAYSPEQPNDTGTPLTPRRLTGILYSALIN